MMNCQHVRLVNQNLFRLALLLRHYFIVFIQNLGSTEHLVQIKTSQLLHLSELLVHTLLVAAGKL
jgi:hypothetical protein